MAKIASSRKKKNRALEIYVEPEVSPDSSQGDLFLCDIANWPVKDDLASMEIPLFSLSKSKDLRTREYTRGNKSVSIRPSTDGAATVFDKDLLLYISSQIIAALNEGNPISKTVRINSSDFLQATCRSNGGNQYAQIINMLRRLKGTTIETNIKTGGVQQAEGFGLIDKYQVLASEKGKGKTNAKGEISEVEYVHEFTVTISDWLFNGLKNFETLTLDRNYFLLSQSIERRLYEIAKKHCGDKAYWKINIDLLAEKIGSSGPRHRLREDIKRSIKNDQIPDYKIGLDSKVKPDMVVFITRDSRKLHKELTQSLDVLTWYQSLILTIPDKK